MASSPDDEYRGESAPSPAPSRALIPTPSQRSTRRTPPNPLAALSPEARSAWEASFLGGLRPDVTGRLLADATEVDVPAGQIVYRGRGSDEPIVLAVVLDGLLRVYRQSDQGRQVTVRYVGAGDVIGVPAVLARGAPVDVQAFSACRLLQLRAATFSEVAAGDASTAWAVAAYLAEVVLGTQGLLAENVFLSVRQRVARHLLDLAEREEGRLVVRASHQDVANAIGSVREVVSRVLVALRAEGLVQRDDSLDVLPDPAALHRVARSG